MPKCSVCNEEKDWSEFHTRKDSKSGYRKDCKVCVNTRNLKRRENNIDSYRASERNRPKDDAKLAEIRRIKYATDPEFRLNRAEYQKEYKARNKDKTYARQKVYYEVLYGRIVKPKACEHYSDTEKVIQAHHWSYLEENWLDVVWLCQICHGKEHKRLNELGRDPDKQIELEK